MNSKKNKEASRAVESPRKAIPLLPIISIEETPSVKLFKHYSDSSDNDNDSDKYFYADEKKPRVGKSLKIHMEDERLEKPPVRRMTDPAGGKFSNALRRSLSEEAKLEEIRAEQLEERLKSLASAFSARTKRTKAKIKQPPTPSSSDSETDESSTGEATLLDRLRMLTEEGSQFGDGDGKRKSISQKVRGSCLRKLRVLFNVLTCNYILDADGTFYVSWLALVCLCFLYNVWVIPLRAIFPYQTDDNLHIWSYLDYFSDAVYAIDIIAFKSHRKFIKEGFWIKEASETRKSYFKTLQFKIDLAALFPADIVVSLVYQNYPLLRLPRILKIDSFWELFRRFDTILASPHSARIARTCIYMMFMIHSNACAYYGLSKWEGIGTTTWTFDGVGNAYIRCFYFATKTATSIGKNPKPENEMEYIFMTFAWLSGVFVFAILIGQIRDIIATATRNQEEYRAMTYAAMSYLHRLGVPKKLQGRVQLWLSYTWEQQKTLDESKILDLLPNKMRTDVALNLHVETLSKVKLFQNCETAFLRDLVVKLRSIIFLPGDYVCRKGEVGREMFIVKSGKIHVIGGPSGQTILATLGEGSVFGEIALLGIGGMNKRTADVRAAGFSNLFMLTKSGLDEAIRDYPAAQEMMRKKAKKLLKDNIRKARAASTVKESDVSTTSQETVSEFGEEVIIGNKPEPPKLIGTMMQIFPPDTKMGRYLTLGSKANSEISLHGHSIDTMISYPPTPYMPTSPGHISPELDISIMSGDSSEKLLSPPPPTPPSSKQGRKLRLSQNETQPFTDNPNALSDSCSSAEELKTYLDTDDFNGKRNSTTLSIINDEASRCPTPLPTFKSPSETENDSVEFPTQNFPDGPSSSKVFVQHPGVLNPTPRRLLSDTRYLECSDEIASVDVESCIGGTSFSGSEIGPGSGLGVSREILPVIQRPPMYPIVLGAFPGVSLSSSEESEEHDIGAGKEKIKIAKAMTPRSAAIIASRFLTAIKTRAPLTRQHGLDDRQESAENPTQDPDLSLDYDTE